MTGKIWSGFLSTTALWMGLGIFSAYAHGQAVPLGTTTPPGSHVAAPGNCSFDANGMPSTGSDASCTQLAPGFVSPSTNTVVQPEKPVMAVIRVEAVVPRPASVPFPMSFDTLGSATMVKAKMPRLYSCFTAGKILSNRSGAATSTTCLDDRGEVIAYQECKPKTGDTAMVCSTVLPSKEMGPTLASAKR